MTFPDVDATRSIGNRVSVPPKAFTAEYQKAGSEPVRWVVWSARDLTAVLDEGLRPSRIWDCGEVHRLRRGGWDAQPQDLWLEGRGLLTDVKILSLLASLILAVWIGAVGYWLQRAPRQTETELAPGDLGLKAAAAA